MTDISARDVESIVREHQLRGVRIPGTNMVRTDVTRDALASDGTNGSDGTANQPPGLPKALTRS